MTSINDGSVAAAVSWIHNVDPTLGMHSSRRAFFFPNLSYVEAVGATNDERQLRAFVRGMVGSVVLPSIDETGNPTSGGSDEEASVVEILFDVVLVFLAFFDEKSQAIFKRRGTMRSLEEQHAARKQFSKEILVEIA
ncbi:hypothetical protein QFC19_001747 [Naganishia cerealis]|uniref:Uncharacterized protein n=1 Tax=Naganishia cerealis TaxID=610337 RepID=A0ACC2WF75_9TREE|nr:hypothetical protein QFC19_001747 [Naganishia cerealis]